MAKITLHETSVRVGIGTDSISSDMRFELERKLTDFTNGYKCEKTECPLFARHLWNAYTQGEERYDEVIIQCTRGDKPCPNPDALVKCADHIIKLVETDQA